MATKLVYIAVIILALIAVFLGYKIYQQQTSLMPGITTPSTPPSNTQSSSQNSQISPPILESTTSTQEQELIKRVPLPAASLEERIAFTNELAKYERETGVIIVSNCKPTPMILRVKGETQFSIKNNDNVEYKISVGGQGLTLAPNGTATMKAGKADGITDISCNGGIQGLVHMHE